MGGVWLPENSSRWLCIPSPPAIATCSVLLERDSIPENTRRPARRVAVFPSRIRIPQCYPAPRRGCAGTFLLHRRPIRFHLFSETTFTYPLYLSLRNLCPSHGSP